MASIRVSMTFSPELAAAVDELANARQEDRSRTVETLLREHPELAHRIVAGRGGAAPRYRKGRSEADVQRLVRHARATWARWQREGKVGHPGTSGA